MNKQLALEMRGNLRLIIEAYESFLFSEVQSGNQSLVATEALVSRDLIRTIGMSEVSKKRADFVLTRNSATTEATNDTGEAPIIETSVSPLAAELGVIGSVTQPRVTTERDGDNLFRNLKDCIPCNQNWSLGSIDFGQLAAILTTDLKSRLSWILRIESLLNENDVILRLCGLLRAFKDLCPQDILVLIAVLTAYLTKTISSIKFNFDSALKDILSMILRPYIGGLEDFLNIYIQFLVDQIDCILNAVQVSAEQLRDLDIDITIGERENLTAEEIRSGDTAAFKFKRDIITGAGDEFLDATASGTKRVREFLRHDTREYVHKLTNDIPDYLVGLARDGIDWIEAETARVQDIVIDFLGGEWLLSSQNLSWIEQMRSVSTLIQLLKVILSLGNIDDLCSKDSIQRVIDEFNDRQPDSIGIIEFADSPGEGNPSLGQTSDVLPNLTDQGQNRVTSEAPSRRYNISVAPCLKPSSDSLINKWIQELS